MIRKPRTLEGQAPSEVASRFPGHRRLFKLIAFALLLGPTAAIVRGQTYLQSSGVPAFTTKLPIENGWIDASNGRLHLEIPLGSFPQRGLPPYNIVLMYDSNIWTHAGTSSWQPTNASTGWRAVSSGSGSINYFYSESRTMCRYDGLPEWVKWGSWNYTSPDGTVHYFPTVATYHKESSCNGYEIPNAGGFASDASGYYLNVTNYTYGTVLGPDGTIRDSKDSNGNFFGSTDTVGRVPVTTGTVTGGTSYTLPNANGDNTSVYTVHTGTISVNTNFAQTGVTECSSTPPSSCTLTVVTDVVLPDGSKYIFGYDSGTTGAHYGQLTSMTLPTGGQITYSWNLYTDSQGNKYPWINSRTTPDSATAWTYTPAVVSVCGAGQVNCQQTLTVAKPNGDSIAYTFALNGGAWANTVKSYAGSGGLLSTVTECWNFVTITQGVCTYNTTTSSPATGVTKMADSTTLPLPNGTTITKTTQYSYDGYGNTTLIQENKFYTGNLPAADRTTTITYLGGTSYFNANIVNRRAGVTVKNSSNVTVAQTNYFYDQYALTSVTGVVNHDDTNYGTSNTVRGNLTEVQHLISGTSNFLTTYMTYDTTGQVTTSYDSKGNITSYGYANHYVNGTPPGPTNAFPTTITTPLSLSATGTYYYGTGQVASATDANNNTTNLTFADVFNRPKSTSLPNGAWTLSQYDLSTANPPLEIGTELYTGITSPSTSGTGCSSCRHDKAMVDGLGRTINSYLVNDPDGQTAVDRTYDTNGRVTTVSNPYRGSPNGVETLYYDGLDRVYANRHADSNVAYTFYGNTNPDPNASAQQSCPSGAYGYGYPTVFIDESWRARETWTDGFGRVIETDEPDATWALTVYTCYQYDLNDNPIGVVSAGGAQSTCTLNGVTFSRCYSYDLLSRITSAKAPESGTTSYSYTASGGGLCSGNPSAVCQRTDARGITTTYCYDALNRLTGKKFSSVSCPLSSPDIAYYYDQTTYNGLSIANGKGRRTGMSDSSGQTAWSFDSVGKVLAETQTINGQTKTINYTYNLDGSIHTIQYPGLRTITYTEGNAQRMTAVVDSTNQINYATAPPWGSPMYAPTGAPANVIHGYVSGGFAGITESYTYNNRLQVASIRVTSTAATPLDLSFGYLEQFCGFGCNYYNSGIVVTQTNNAASGRTQNYTYDPLTRLLTAQSAATSGGDCWGQSFGNGGPPSTMAADALANLFYTSSINCSSPAPQYTMNTSNNNQFTGTGISYDAAGNMTADTAFTYTYDAENRIVTATGMSGGPYCYTYDGNGLRVKKAHASGGSCTGTVSVDMLYWHDFAGNEIAHTDGTGSMTNSGYVESIFFAGRRIAVSNPPTGALHYLFVDHLGSTRVMTDATGTADYEVDYLPYGTENTPAGFTNTSGTRYQFTGYERDAETAYGTSSGNDYAFARYYNSRLGRFMTPDPAGLLVADASDPQSWNQYAYVEDDSDNLTDPLGLDPSNCGMYIPPDPENGNPGGQILCGTNDCQPPFICGGGNPWNPKLPPGPAKQPPKRPTCPAVFKESTINALDKMVSFPAGSGPEDAAKAIAAAFAAKHIIDRGLVVALRSSIVRGIYAIGELAAEVAIAAPVIYSEGVGLTDEVQALRSGTCRTIWSSK
jgi:RHS repeat-associated protein